MFAESTRDLTYLSRQLAVLRADQLWRLACWTSPFGLSDAEARCVDAATATVTGGGEGVVKSSTTQPPSLVFGWNTYGLHCIYKCIARVAGNLSANHPSEYRDILQHIVPISLPKRWYTFINDRPRTSSPSGSLKCLDIVEVAKQFAWDRTFQRYLVNEFFSCVKDNDLLTSERLLCDVSIIDTRDECQYTCI
uniref:Lateral signaling target protein 2 n=1 Tax=Echinococcus granulosus TaxID=6210 RepID=A0A068WM58_ECHGR|nr:lateral signaling target protein 2 [Echinococcus granulosus]